MHDKPKTMMNRRNFLGALGGASAVAAATATASFPTETRAYDPGDEETKSRYRETEHVKTFYRVNAYPPRKK